MRLDHRKLEAAMVQISLALDDFGGLVCALRDGKTESAASASNVQDALAGLLAAIEATGVQGTGECFWLRESGVYRWLIRRTNQKARLVVLWSAGTLTGWQNVFWADTEWDALESTIREQINRCAVQAGPDSLPRGS